MQLHLLLTSVLHEGERLTSRPGRFTLGMSRYPSIMRLRGPHSRSGSYAKDKNLLSQLGFFLRSLVLSFYFIRTCFCRLDCPVFCLLSVLTTHNTNILALGGIRTPNFSRRTATDQRPSSADSKPGPPQPVA